MASSAFQTLRFWFVLGLARWSLAQSLTAFPGFQGFKEIRDNYYSENRCLSNLVYSTFVSYAGCVDPTGAASSAVVVDCISGIYTFGDGFQANCSTRTLDGQTATAGWTGCVTRFIIDDKDSPASATQFYCARTASRETLTRTLPPGAVYITQDGNVPQTIPGGSTPISTSIELPETSSIDPNPSSPEDFEGEEELPNEPNTPRRGRSKSWIAGAVVGPIAALVILIGAILVWLRRRKAKKAALHDPPINAAYHGTNFPPSDKPPMQAAQPQMSPSAPTYYSTNPNPTSPHYSYSGSPPLGVAPQGSHPGSPGYNPNLPPQNYAYNPTSYGMGNTATSQPMPMHQHGHSNSTSTSPTSAQHITVQGYPQAINGSSNQSQVQSPALQPTQGLSELPERNIQSTEPR